MSRLKKLFEHSDTIFKAVLVSIMLLEFIMLPWIVNQIVMWGDLELESANVTGLIVAPFVLFLLLTPVAVYLARFRRFADFLLRLVLIPLIIVQIIIDLILYLYLIRSPLFDYLFPLDIASLPSGWLKPEAMPIILIGTWLIVGFGILIPVVTTCLFALNKSYIRNEPDEAGNVKTVANFIPSVLLGFALFSLMMSMRWGSSWGFPLVHMCWLVALIPVLLLLFPSKKYMASGPSVFPESIKIRLLSGASVFYFLGIYLFLAEFNANTAASGSLMWLVLTTTSLVLLSIYYKKASNKGLGINASGFSNKSAILTWAILIGLHMLINTGGISAAILRFDMLWIGLSMIFLATIPFLLQAMDKKQPRVILPLGIRLFVWLIAFIIGAAIPILSHIGDPLSTYIVYVLDVFSIIILIGFVFVKARKPQSR